MYVKRNSRLTADITLATHNLLREACLKFDAPKGKLLEKMIIRFCAINVEPIQIEPVTTVKGDMSKAKRSKPKKAAAYPSNLDEMFEMLWDIKGKKGAKNGVKGAYEIFKKMSANVSEETCEFFTKTLIDDILKNSGECGYPELHLTTYLNQQRWDK